jgi:Fe-S oxidoreductase
MKIEGITDEVQSCLQCGFCRSICPVYEQVGWESASPRGKMYHIKQLTQRSFIDTILRKKIDINEDFIREMYLCLGCGACEEVCHAGLNIQDVWRKVKTWIFENGLMNVQEYRQMHDAIKVYKNPYSEPPEKRDITLPKNVTRSRNPEVVIFQGCTDSYTKQGLVQTAAKLCEKGGVPFTTLGKDEWCCGSMCFTTGQTDYIKEFAVHNVRAIKETGAQKVIAPCALCYDTLKKEYPNIVGDLPFEVYHIAQFLEEMITDGRLELSTPIRKTVTFHDPCHLGRHEGVIEPPRNLIKNIQDITLVEMDRNKKLSRCCGGGSGCNAGFSDIAQALAKDRLNEAKKTGAELLVTTCPIGKLHLNQVAQNNGYIKTVDILELVGQAI